MQQNSDILPILIRRAWLVILGLIIGVGLAALVSSMMAPVYRSSAYLLVVPAYDRADTSLNDDIERRLRNDYAQVFSRLATEPRVIGEAVRDSGARVDPEGIERYLEISVSPNAPILEIAGNTDDPEAAANLATAVAQGITSFTEEGAEDTGYQTEFMSEATPSINPVAPGWRLNIAVGAAAGLLVGVMVALFWDSLMMPLRLLWELGAVSRKARSIRKENQRRERLEKKDAQRREEQEEKDKQRVTHPFRSLARRVQILAYIAVIVGVALAVGIGLSVMYGVTSGNVSGAGPQPASDREDADGVVASNMPSPSESEPVLVHQATSENVWGTSTYIDHLW